MSWVTGQGHVMQAKSKSLKVPAGRFQRLARMGALTSGIAGRGLWQAAKDVGQGQRPKLRDALLTPANITALTDELAKMRGAAMKMGQLLSMDAGDILPPEVASIMARLRDSAHHMPPAQLKTVLTTAWGKDWQRSFAQFDPRPMAAASIGQVHKAKLSDGRDVAIKVQYPGVAHSIDSDVANVGALIKLSGLWPGDIALGPYLEEAKTQLRAETDYLQEGQHMAAFGQHLAQDPRFAVPGFIAGHSTRDVLVMSFENGHPIEDTATAPQATRDAIGRALIDLVLQEVFDFGLVQTDPNFANYRFDPQTQKIVLLDFGATRTVPPKLAQQYQNILRCGMAGDVQGVENLAQDMGLLSATDADAHRVLIAQMIDTVFAALSAPWVFDFGETSLPEQLQSQGTALWNAGFVPAPAPMDAVFLQRKFGGMFLLAQRLKARVDIQDALRPFL